MPTAASVKKDGVPLVFNPHFTGNIDSWDPAVTDGLAQGREVIPFDNAGVGSSSGEVPHKSLIMPNTTPGLRTVVSHFGPKATMDRLEAEIRKRGMEMFIRIDHAAGAAGAGLELPPTELIVFGNAQAGTPLMQAN